MTTLPITPGEVYGRLTVQGLADPGRRYSRRYICRCICGVEKTVVGSDLRHNRVKSCGCLRREQSPKNRTARRLELYGFPIGRPRNDDKPCTERFPVEPSDWPVRSKLVFRCLRRGAMARREVVDRTLLTGDAVAEALEHLMRVDIVREMREGKEYRYDLSLEVRVHL